MPWEQTSAMDERVQFIADWLSGDYFKIELCTAYGISRPTADKWIRRYQEDRVKGLEELSRAPYSHPNATHEEVREQIIQGKLDHQNWGTKKVMDYLRENYPLLDWPADSTAGEILKRAGLVKPRHYHSRVAPYSEPFGTCQGPIRSGVRTSREIFFWATVGVVTRSRSATTSLVICFCVVPWSTPATRRSDPGWSGRFGNMGCLRRFVAITGCRLLLWHWAASASSRSGGFSSGSGRSALSPVSQAKTDATNGCTERSSTMLHHKRPSNASNTVSICFWRNTIGNVRMKRWEEKRPPVCIVSLHAATRLNSRPSTTTRDYR